MDSPSPRPTPAPACVVLPLYYAASLPSSSLPPSENCVLVQLKRELTRGGLYVDDIPAELSDVLFLKLRAPLPLILEACEELGVLKRRSGRWGGEGWDRIRASGMGIEVEYDKKLHEYNTKLTRAQMHEALLLLVDKAVRNDSSPRRSMTSASFWNDFKWSSPVRQRNRPTTLRLPRGETWEPPGDGASLIDSLCAGGHAGKLFASHDEELRDVLDKKWTFRLPLGSVFSYFGCNVALYFAFLNQYTRWLLLPSVLGAVAAYIGQEKLWIHLPFFNLSIEASLLLTIVLMHMWADTFLVMWTRREAYLSNDWMGPDVGAGGLPSRNAGRRWSEILNLIIKGINLFICLCLALCMHIPLGFAALTVLEELQQWKGNYAFAKYAGMAVNIMMIEKIKVVGTYIGSVLTKFEDHASKDEEQSSFIAKSLSFHLIGSLLPFFFLAFIRRDSDALKMLLFQRLLVGQAMNNIVEVLVPLAKTYFEKHKKKKRSHQKRSEANGKPFIVSPIEEEYLMEGYNSAAVNFEGIDGRFEDMLELVNQFAMIMLFTAAGLQPFAPALCLLNNIIEARSDGFKLRWCLRCADPGHSRRLSGWIEYMSHIAFLSLPLNLAMIYFLKMPVVSIDNGNAPTTTDNLFLLIILLVVGHIVVHLKWIVNKMIPKIPHDVKDAEVIFHST